MEQLEQKTNIYAQKLLTNVENWLIDSFRTADERFEALSFIYAFFRELEPDM